MGISSTFSEMVVPEYTNSEDQRVIITGRVQPADAGREISLRTGGAGSWSSVATTTTDAAGRFTFDHHVSYAQEFSVRALSQGNYDAQHLNIGQIRSLHLWDDFDYADADALLAGQWSLRQPLYSHSAGSSRSDTRSDASMLDLDNGILTMKVRPDPNPPAGTADIPLLVSHLTTGVKPDFVRGHIECRMKFGRPKGAHGAFWHQGSYQAGEHELDVVEFFGERFPDYSGTQKQASQYTIHVGTGLPAPDETKQFARLAWANGIPSNPGENAVHTDLEGAVGGVGTWWNYFHTYEVFWSDTEYTFKVDGVLVGKTVIDAPGALTPGPVATEPGEFILSLLVKDYERLKMDPYIAGGGSYADYDVKVDWVRAWR